MATFKKPPFVRVAHLCECGGVGSVKISGGNNTMICVRCAMLESTLHCHHRTNHKPVQDQPVPTPSPLMEAWRFARMPKGMKL